MKAPRILLLVGPFLLAGHADPSSHQTNPHSDLKMDCSDCHSPQRWKPTKRNLDFDHGKTGFPLSGSHASVLCMECHKDLKFQSVSSSCADCHEDIHKGKFGTDCQACHTTRKWSAEFLTIEAQAHNQFPLVGFHAIDECAKCHKNQEPKNYANTPTNCSACHMGEFDKTSSPSHRASNFSTDCASCHASAIVSGWRGGTGGTRGMTHPATLPLAGAHGKISCYECHSKNTFAGLIPECSSCHQDDFDQATKPNHKEAAFPTDCASCHSNENWRVGVIPEGAQFKHPQTFPLTGGHAKPKCAECHSQGYVGTKPECAGCHEKDFVATTKPDHTQQKFGMNCAQCHNTGVWEGALIPPGSDFQHPATFPLKGGHGVASCADCHKDGKYTGTPKDCLACHKTDFDATTNPNHTDLNFPTDCKQCHTVDAWKGAQIDPRTPFQHPAGFPLVAGHGNVSCMECHANGYTNTPKDCNSCHDDDYRAAMPNHANLQLPTDCALCHTNVAWKGANFPPNIPINHPATFPLTRPHDQANCTQCHAGGYTNTATDCYSCHKADYEVVLSPNHVTANYSKDCLSCHKRDTWDGATFDHERFFPIATGRHSGFQCSQCHVVDGNSKAFECILCHAHGDKAKVDDKHRGENGYRYTSEGCYSCHPRGKE